MHKKSSFFLPAWVKAGACAIFIAAYVLPSSAVETKFWQQGDFSDFEKGNLNKISVSSDGRLLLAPALTEVLDSSTPYLWAVALDPAGAIYAGGGGPTGSAAKLFRVTSGGQSTVAAELPGLEIHAIAVDRHGVVFAATAPDGKVYRISNGKAEVFFDPHAKYIWALAFSPNNDLFVATGDSGVIYKVTPDGKGAAFFQTEETHARSMAVDQSGNLIIGTEPNGLILRVTPAGEGFVLYQAPKREITAVAVSADGAIYAAGAGNRAATPAPPPTAVGAPPQAAPATPTPPGVVQIVAPSPTPAALPILTSQAIAGGSEIYRIQTDGYPRRIWSHAQDLVYALAFDA